MQHSMQHSSMLLPQIHERLKHGLNRPINDTFTKTLVRKYFDNNKKEDFLVYAKALGVPDSLALDTYSMINENASSLDEELSHEPKVKSHKKTKNKLDLGLEQSDEQVLVPLKRENQLLDLLEEEQKPKNQSMKFKKIKKQDAIRLRGSPKEPPGLQETESTKNLNGSVNRKPQTIAEMAALESNTQPQEPETNLKDYELSDDDIDKVGQDRDWYMTDEMGHAMDYDYSNFNQEPIKPTPRRKMNATGGHFDSRTGDYIDYDHDNQNLHRVPITTHHFVPPFLQSLERYLQPNLVEKVKEKGTINPIKNPNSELAISAKRGSFVVNERRSKNERAKQAKDSSSLQGTALGNVLQIKEEKEVSATTSGAEEKVDKELIQKQRKSLPAFAVRHELLRTIAENQVTVVIGETGSGKTTQLTQFLLEDGFGSNLAKNGERLMIGCTQPRRVAAMSVAKRVSEEYGCKLGEEVGYSIRFEDVTTKEKTIIKYMTEGVLLREILMDANLEHYSCIIMDEAHERSLSTDVLLGLFRNLIRRRKDLKLIITSATMNAERFMNFFGDVPQFTIPGRTFPVDTLFSKSTCSDYVDAAVKQVMTVHLQNYSKYKRNDGDILVFMTGQEDIEMTCELVREKLALLDDPPPLDVYPIYSTMPADLQRKIFDKPSETRRKVVVATNIAETSLTVDGIKYVVDTGLVKLKVYNPKLGMDTLQVVPISLANAQQRSGRAGRTGPGLAYRLYTERAIGEDLMYIQPIPEIQRTNLTNVMLLLKSLKVEDVTKFPFLDSPPTDLLSNSLYDLWIMEALDNCGNLTSLGHNMMVFPIEATLSKLIFLSCRPQFSCSSEIVTIVSMLSVPSVFFRPKERAQESDAARERFFVAESDHLTLLNVYNQYETQRSKGRKTAAWCSKNFLHHKSLSRARDIRNQLILIMKKNKLPILKSTNNDTIRKCLCAVYFHQLATLAKTDFNKGSVYTHLRQSYMNMHLHPTSALNSGAEAMASHVIYHELILTTKEYMSCVTVVDPVWLLEFGAIFFDTTPAVKQRIQEQYGVSLRSKEQVIKELERDSQALLVEEAKVKKESKHSRLGKKRAF